jgi:hypothetical protein
MHALNTVRTGALAMEPSLKKVDQIVRFICERLISTLKRLLQNAPLHQREESLPPPPLMRKPPVSILI